MLVLSMAARNIARDWRRSLVTGGAMALAALVMILYTALIGGMLEAGERNVTDMDLGEVQAHHPGYRDDADLYNVIKHVPALLARIDKQKLAVTPRLYAYGLASSGSTSSGVAIRGVDIEREKTVTRIHQHVAQGQWLSSDHPKGVVLGKRLARSLSSEPGSEVIIISQAADGSMANDIYHVRGILKSVGGEVDEGGFFMPDASFRELMALEQGVHELAFRRLDPGMTLEQAVDRVRQAAPGLEVKSWKQLKPAVAAILGTAKGQTLFMLGLIYTAVGLIILNAMLMSVFERIHQFGIMKAIGVTPWKLVGLILTETALIAALASAFAVALGVPGMFWLASHGIDLTAVAGDASFAGVAIDPVWRAKVSAQNVLIPVIFLFAIALLAALYPALKAARIRPVEAINYT